MAIIKCFLLILIYASSCFAKTIIVDKNSSVNSIKKAITLAAVGDTILITNSVYNETNLIIDKSITLIGLSNPTIKAFADSSIMIIKSDNVVIEGITFEDTPVSFIDDNAALLLDEVNNCTVRNNIFKNNFFAIYLAKSSNSLITDNTILNSAKRESSSGNGIHLWYCKGIKILNNKIIGHRDGIYLEFVRSSNIRNNFSQNNLRYGLHFMFSDSCSYSNNTFTNNGAGVAVMFTKFVEMFDNIFIDNWGSASYGLLLKDIFDSNIYNNVFEKNTTGIYLEGCNRINIYENSFNYNGWAIRLMANSYDNKFTKNNFIGNSFDVATNSSRHNNLFSKNYWAYYSGYDLDHDGYGDSPYRPVKLYSLLTEKNKPTIILMKSFFVNLLDIAENIIPVLTPETLVDESPLMRKVK